MSSTATVKKTTKATEGVRTRSTSRASRKEENSQDRTIRVDPGQTIGVGPRETGVSSEEITKEASNEIPLGRTRRGTQELRDRIEAAKSKITSQSPGGATGFGNLTTGNAATSVLSRIGLDYGLGPTSNNEEQEYEPILPEILTGPRETEGESSRGRSKTREPPFDDLWQEEEDEELAEQYLTAREDPDNHPVRFEEGLSFDETRGSQIAEQEELEKIEQETIELKQQRDEAIR